MIVRGYGDAGGREFVFGALRNPWFALVTIAGSLLFTLVTALIASDQTFFLVPQFQKSAALASFQSLGALPGGGSQTISGGLSPDGTVISTADGSLPFADTVQTSRWPPETAQ